MINKRTPSQVVFNVFNVIILLIMTAAFLLPVLHVAFGSVSDPARLTAHSGVIQIGRAHV